MTSEHVAAEVCDALGGTTPQIETYESREVTLGGLKVVRALPVHGRKLVGPWCFLDRMEPATFAKGQGVDIGAHPHIGLQTVSWLLDGELLHQDSLGSESLLRSGGVNVMTAGRGIAHSERTPNENSGRLDGVQLWVALPSAHKDVASGFEHVAEVPTQLFAGATARVFAGSLAGISSPAKHFSQLVGADIALHRHASAEIPVDPAFEHALIILSGDCLLNGVSLRQGVLNYLGTARSSLTVASEAGARLLLLGGPPFPETILMWWNFVARTPEEIAAAREDWQAHRRFTEVQGYIGPRLDAPSLNRIARPEVMS